MLTKTPSDVMQIDEVEHEVKSKSSTSTLEEITSLEKMSTSIADDFENNEKTAMAKMCLLQQKISIDYT